MASTNLQPPTKNSISESNGLVERAWSVFFREIERRLNPYGVEKYASLTNNQLVAADVEGLIFNKAKVSMVAVDYLIQRVTTGVGATELIEGGTFYLVYKPTSANWALTNGPSTAGITLSVTAGGQVQHVSTNVSGTQSISKMTYRPRTLAAKNTQYSEAGE